MSPQVDVKPIEPIAAPHLRTADRDLRSLLSVVAGTARPQGSGTQLPMVSVAFDNRPTNVSDDPDARAGRVLLRDAFRRQRSQLAEHTPEYESLVADEQRVFAELDALQPDANGLVLFACNGAGLFETARLGASIEDDVEIGDAPHLLPLVRIIDHARALVALVDTNTMRLFRARYGGLEELPSGIDDDPYNYEVVSAGGWREPNNQRHSKEYRKAFARIAAERINDELTRSGDDFLILAGIEVAVPILEHELPKPARDRLVSKMAGDMHMNYAEVVALVDAPLDEIHRSRVADRTDIAIGEARASDMGAIGREDVKRFLELGAVMELFIDSGLDSDHHVEPYPAIDWVDELVRLAASTDADIHVVPEHPGLQEAGRVAATLRFRP